MRVASRLVLNSLTVAALLVGGALVVEHRNPSSPGDAATAGTDGSGKPARTRQDWLIAGIALLAGGAVVAALLTRRTWRPVRELRDVAAALVAGDLGRRPLVEADGELAQLANSVRALGQQLEERRQELRAADELLVALTESLNEGVVAVDARRQVVRLNQTARQQLGLREPVPFLADFLPRDRTLRETLATVMSGKLAAPGEVRVEDRTFSLTARPLPDGGAILAFYDLTPFRRLEAVRRDFVANVSHELRTPLTVIAGAVETLQDDDLPPDVRRQFLGMATGNVRRMQRIVDDLLDLSRIESGGWLPNPVELDFPAVANEVCAPLQAAAQDKHVALRIESAPAATIYADPTAVRQILSNLAENALRHTLSGEVVLFHHPDPDGVWVGVRDTGIGMDPEHLPRIFERFYRADPSRSREAGGTGLGLAIVRHLAEAHGGRVRAESTPGVGTTIATYFPSA